MKSLIAITFTLLIVGCAKDNQVQDLPSKSSGNAVLNPQSNDPQITYYWAPGTFGACSATCGGGTQTRAVNCIASDGAVVAESFCTTTKPAVSQACNAQACTWQPIPAATAAGLMLMYCNQLGAPPNSSGIGTTCPQSMVGYQCWYPAPPNGVVCQ